MSNPKTDELERDEVISWYEKEHGITLVRTNNKKRKVLRDEKGRLYCFLVAREDWQHWHGLDSDILTNEKDWNDGLLIIGIRHKDSIHIYQENIRPLLQRKQLLTRRHTFHTVQKGNQLYVKEVPEFKLKKVGEASSTTSLRDLMEKLKNSPGLLNEIQKKLEEI